jgi:threonine dehydrogenase-like Zn-dependent dehydrogenase
MMVEALLLSRELSLSIGQRELPVPAHGQALVRVAWAGLCGSDLHVLRTGSWVGYWPATLGHEVYGVVEECPGGEVEVGTAVVVDSRLPCGTCPGCQVALSLCERMTWLGEAIPGGFAQYLLVPSGNLVPCPDGLEGAIAVLAEPLAVAIHAVSRLRSAPLNVLVLGYGPVGALVHAELERRWPRVRVVVSEPVQARLELALAMGAEPLGEPVAGQGERFDLVVDASGHAGSFNQACLWAANGGTVLLVALCFDGAHIVPAEVVERTLTITGSVGFDDELGPALAVLASRPERYRALVTEAVLLKEVPARLGDLSSAPPAGKMLVRPWQD